PGGGRLAPGPSGGNVTQQRVGPGGTPIAPGPAGDVSGNPIPSTTPGADSGSRPGCNNTASAGLGTTIPDIMAGPGQSSGTVTIPNVVPGAGGSTASSGPPPPTTRNCTCATLARQPRGRHGSTPHAGRAG